MNIKIGDTLLISDMQTIDTFNEKTGKLQLSVSYEVYAHDKFISQDGRQETDLYGISNIELEDHLLLVSNTVDGYTDWYIYYYLACDDRQSLLNNGFQWVYKDPKDTVLFTSVEPWQAKDLEPAGEITSELDGDDKTYQNVMGVVFGQCDNDFAMMTQWSTTEHMNPHILYFECYGTDSDGNVMDSSCVSLLEGCNIKLEDIEIGESS